MRLEPWVWVCCYLCGHTRAIPFAPWAIRWEPDRLADKIRQRFYCSRCGERAVRFLQAGRAPHGGYADFPDKPVCSIGGRRNPGESPTGADARNKAEYLAKYPGGDALGAFRGGPPGPASMCGKFTAMASWAEVVAFSQPLTREEVTENGNDRIVTFRVMSNLPVIIWDAHAGTRRVVPMRWGWPHPKNWKVPQPIHARAESIDDPRKPFARPFHGGQRGIVIVRTFNEAPDVPGVAQQHTITPGDLGAIGIAFVWKRFELGELPGTLDACVMVTVPANGLIATLPTDRMPAVLADADWAAWLGERGTPEDARACLKTVEGVRWTMTKEEKQATAKRRKPALSDPKGLL